MRAAASGAGLPTTAERTASRASVAVFAVFALNGFVFASWVSRLPAVRDALGLTPAQIGVVLLVGSAGSIVALPLTGAVIQRVGTARTTRGAALLTGLGFTAAAGSISAGSTPLLATSLFVGAMGIGAWDVSMNLQGAIVEHARSRAIMPRFHAGFSLGAVVGAGLGALAAGVGLPVAWHVVLAVVIAVGLTLALTGAYLPDPTHPSAPGPDHAPDPASVEAGTRGTRSGRRPSAFAAWAEPRTVLIGLMVLAAALTEGSANDWLALAVVDGFEASDAWGAMAFGIFVASMTAMRFAGTRLLDSFGRVAVLRLCAASAIVGLALFGLAPTLPLALVGAVLWGLGAALGFPVGMSAASDDPVRAAARVSVVATIGYVAFLAGPPLLGLLADRVGYRSALLVILLPLALSLVLARYAAPAPNLTLAEPDAAHRAAPSAAQGIG